MLTLQTTEIVFPGVIQCRSHSITPHWLHLRGKVGEPGGFTDLLEPLTCLGPELLQIGP